MRSFSFVGWASTLAMLGLLLFTKAALADGAVLYKSGPIQASTDGEFVWFVNQDHDSVTRLATADNSIMEFPLPAATAPNSPRALALRPGTNEVWVAAYDTDKIYILDGATGQETATIPLRYGAGPVAIAFTPTGDRALIAFYRADTVAVVDTSSREILKTFDNMASKPLSITFTGPATAYVAHQFNDGEQTYLSVIDSAELKLAYVHRVRSIDPKFNFQIPADDPQIPEGGWIFPTSQISVNPSSGEVWVPTQLHNFRPTHLTADTVIQAAVLKVNTASNEIDLNNRVIFTAIKAHNQQNQLIGDGWNAGVAGPSDIAFNADGSIALITMAHSNDVLVVPQFTGLARPIGEPALQELPVGDNPIGLVWAPVADKVYVLNHLSRDVSVIDPATWSELDRVPAVISEDPVDPQILLGEKLFHTSADIRTSINQKVSCASCHPGGETDGLVWDFAQIGAGRRKTLTMRGQSISMAPQANGRGQLHRSGDRDEIQDFDLTFTTNFMLGSGFLPFPNAPLSEPNAGLSPELDALAAFVLNLPPLMRSPHREPGGEITESAVRGAMLFRLTEGPLATGCVTCHPAPAYTDFGYHDVGGFRPQPEYEGPAYNTPSLVSSWDSGGFRQVVPVGGAGQTRQVGLKMWDVLQATGSAGSQPNLHGTVDQLSQALMRDLEAFLNELDGELAAVDIESIIDTTPPRVIAVMPVSMNSIEVVFSEAIDPVTAGEPANYTVSDGTNTVPVSAAVVNASSGNRVRLTVPLVYTGCTPSTYTVTPGAIADLAAALGAENANLLDVEDESNVHSFIIDGTITVTFGSAGNETFPSVASDASFDPRSGQANTSYDRMILNPTTVPETKGFVKFDFAQTLTEECGVSSPEAILDARFSLMPDFGNATSLEVRRVLKPWGDPGRDNCISCAGALTATNASFGSVPWSLSGARMLGGSGTTVGEYYPNQSFIDAAMDIDGTASLTDLESRIEFTGAGITDAFRFWAANPAYNYGHIVETVGTIGPLVELWSSEADGGADGPILSITFAVPVTPLEPDCNTNGRLDSCDISLGSSQDSNENGIPDECEVPPCPADWNDNGITDVPDIFAFLADWFAMESAADYNESGMIDVPDIFSFLSDWFAGCPD